VTLNELREKTAALSLRERGILCATSLLVVLMLWFQFSFDGLLVEYRRSVQAAAQADTEMLALTESLTALQTRLGNDPNAPLRVERQTLEQDLQRVAHDIETRLEHLVVPERMADLVGRVLADFRGLRLLGAENLAPTPLELNVGRTKPPAGSAGNKPSAGVPDESEQVIFEHGFRMALKGNYFSALEFIQKLEEIEGFYWRSLRYEVADWPEATIIIHVSTLSLQKEWIGV
jgi:MSHA biogenesis protein MshJ